MKKTKHKFVLETTFTPTGDQPTAIKELVAGLERGDKHQVLLGATGTGKTFTIANVIEKVQKPTLILVHNKTLAGQLYAEFKALFPNNRVEYFVSNFDFYQPEAYVPSRDMYIEKKQCKMPKLKCFALLLLIVYSSVMTQLLSLVSRQFMGLVTLKNIVNYPLILWKVK